ncbi:hypothetical protein CAPTEDRAFT_198488 [Capitella teleta]|uniref:Uncharacterized protein n=1 Tax=Capitella teleta TaxID=283909 RepID=R7UE65_CAPTE|nr:hypothetical protein CAPTEDRAFT_198488 [Capitella teleta]|eukprot:ELU04829.1 hypothetical protein CAPTEDRAFT_198488 [Capitella teleta]
MTMSTSDDDEVFAKSSNSPSHRLLRSGQRLDRKQGSVWNLSMKSRKYSQKLCSGRIGMRIRCNPIEGSLEIALHNGFQLLPTKGYELFLYANVYVLYHRKRSLILQTQP